MIKFINNPAFAAYFSYIVILKNAMFIIPLILVKFTPVELSIFLFFNIIGLLVSLIVVLKPH